MLCARFSRFSLSRALVSVTGLGILLNCSEALGPIVLVNPSLSSVTFDSFDSSVKDWGLISLTGIPADSSYRPGGRDRIPLAFTASSGDSEVVWLSPYACGNPPSVFACQDLDLVMKSGFRADSLRAAMDEIPARFISVSVTGSVAGVRVFDPDYAARAIRILRQQPSVQYAGNAALLFTTGIGGGSSNGILGLTGALPLDFASAVRSDGHIQAQSGDTLRIAYRQPDGSQLTSQMIIP